MKLPTHPEIRMSPQPTKSQPMQSSTDTEYTGMPSKPRQRPDSRFLSQPECEALAKRAASMAVGGGDTALLLQSNWYGNLRYARNQITTTGDVRNNDLYVIRDIQGASGTVDCSHIDDVGLEAAIRRAERLLRSNEETGDRRFREHFAPVVIKSIPLDAPDESKSLVNAVMVLVQTVEPYQKPNIFFDSTYQLRATERVQVIEPLIASARKADLRAAGYIEVSAHGRAVMDTWGRSLYYPYTQAQFSVTVRDPKGTGSGWAGVDFSSWTRIDPSKLTEIAMDKCLRSRNPVAVEPGRYTAILEPQAVCDIFTPVVRFLDRATAEGGDGPFAGEDGNSKIGQQVLDPRITLSADPMDPDLGFPPFDQGGNVYHAVNWIETGVLKDLSYNRPYGIKQLGKNSGLPNSSAFRLSGGTSTIDDMIATTKRGLLVTRFYGVGIIDKSSLLCTGYTRDGLWLVENGKITKPVKNFRITESPMFIFNNLEALGQPVRVFRPGAPTVVPPAKVRDFSFSSLSEAI